MNNNSIDELEMNAVAEPRSAAPKLVPSESTRSKESGFEYVESDNIQSSIAASELINPGQSANESLSTSSLGRIQLRHYPDSPRSHAAVDILLTIVCFVVVHFLYLGNLDLSSPRTVALFSAVLLLCFSMYAGGMYSTKALRSLNRELTYLALCWVFAFTALGLFAFLSKTAIDISRVWVTASMGLSLALLAGVRVLSSLGILSSNKENAKKIVILGDSASINPVVRNLTKLPTSQIQVSTIFNLAKHQPDETEYLPSLKHTAQQVSAFVEQQRQSGAAVEQVWVAVNKNQPQIAEEMSDALIDSSVDVCVVPDQYTQRLLKGDVTRYGDTEIVNVSEISLPLAADQFKRVFDFFVASVALILLAVPMIVIAACIKFSSKGPVLFRQKRYGVDGREIEVLKFRSMRVHSDKQVAQASRNDARVTRVGRIIRKTSLDELPQLLNVLTGSMSLVGPRPHAVVHNEAWRQEIHGYMLRHKVRPGITGWAQVNGWRGETDTAYKMQQRVRYDLEYIRNWSPALDLKILFMTVFVGFHHKNAY